LTIDDLFEFRPVPFVLGQAFLACDFPDGRDEIMSVDELEHLCDDEPYGPKQT
jgi:hypothetical protein